jgi:hypothetical protein
MYWHAVAIEGPRIMKSPPRVTIRALPIGLLINPTVSPPPLCV